MGEGTMSGMEAISDAKIRSELSPSSIEKGDIRRDPRVNLLRLARVIRVDPKRMVVDILPQDEQMPRKNVAISFPGSGGRHFLGAIPEVGDICVIGSLPAESGMNSSPVILAWYPPGIKAGNDWIPFRSHAPEEVGMTPTESVAFEGMVSSRRYKLRQMESGHVVASSSQGSDLVLDESASLMNRRGNELVLRDQDQALVVRTLQQFFVGAGYRVYGGMIQRDSTLIPSQMVKSSVDWSSDRQVDGDGIPLSSNEMDKDQEAGLVNPSYVFSSDENGFNDFGLNFTLDSNPVDVLRRGLFINEDGTVYDPKVTHGSVYGGKRIFRVSTDFSDSTSNPGAETFSEYRIEVHHTSDGVLPVSEQTDGIDIDRLLPNTPNPEDPDISGVNRADSPMVEFVLGTAVGNDATNDRESYGVPLVAKISDVDGKRQTVIRPAAPGDTVKDHIAFLVRVRNPLDPNSVSFIGITKGGAYLQSFQGSADQKAVQEDFGSGKQSFYGSGSDGQSRVVEADGTISMSNVGSGRSADNVGVEISSVGGAVVIKSGGSITQGAALGGGGQNSSPARQQIGMKLDSATGTLVSAKNRVQIKSPYVEISDAKSITNTVSGEFSVDSGDTVSISTKSLGVTVNGAAEYVYGGPKDGNATNGASRRTSFIASPLTGAIGGTVDEYTLLFGKRSETIRVGRQDTTINVGSFNVNTMGVKLPSVGFGAGFSIKTGLPLLDNGVSATPASVSVRSNAGVASLTATKGAVTVSGTSAVLVNSIGVVSIQAPLVRFTALGPPGGVLTDGCLDSFTGRPFVLSGSLGAPGLRLG